MTPTHAPLSFTTGDVPAASAVLQATATHLQARGHTLWPPDRLTPQHLQRHYPPGGWHVAWTGAAATREPVGCFCLLTSDPPFWPDDPPGEALYLHKLAVHPSAQGQGLAHTLLREAARVTALAGRPWLKLDTDAARPALPSPSLQVSQTVAPPAAHAMLCAPILRAPPLPRPAKTTTASRTSAMRRCVLT